MIGAWAAAAMRRPRHQILIFHRVLAQPDPMNPSEPTAAWFRQLIAFLSSQFEIIGLDEALDRSADGRLRGRSISITFDDGYADNFTVALPILESYRAPATFFVASGYLDGGRMWNDSIIESFRRLAPGPQAVDAPERRVFTLSDWPSRQQAAAATITAWKHLPPEDRTARVEELAGRVAQLPTDLMMSSEQLRDLAASPVATIGSHTRSHPILACLPASAARAEIESGKRDLEACLRREVDLFAYPNGKRGRDYLPEHATMVREAGFRAALATDWGGLEQATDRFAIPRFTPWHKGLGRFAVDLLRCHYGLV